MKYVIQKRKKRFGAFLLAALLLFSQTRPIVANAADYAVSESELLGKVVQAKDTLTYSSENIGTYSVYYCDAHWSTIHTDTASYNAAYTVLAYNDLSEAPALPENAIFEGWYVKSVYHSGDEHSVTLNARIGYPITYIGTDGATNNNPASYIYGDGVESLVAASKPGYTFEGWFSDSAYATEVTSIDYDVEGEVTLYAKFTQNPSYAITYVLYGGTNGNNPDSYVQGIGTALADASKEGHTFSGWYFDAEFTSSATSVDAAQTGEITLYAKFTVNQYTITFDTVGGSAVDPIVQDYGTVVTAPANPTKNGHTFAAWDKAIPDAMPAEDMTIIAQWNVNKYTVKFVNEDGKELQSSEVAYGETPVYNGETPTKAATAQYTYAFAGWSPEVTAVTGEATYTATYTAEVNWYTVRFVNEDGTELQSEAIAYGEIPVYSGETPTKEATAEHSYTFAGWSPAVAEVTGDATYMATFTESAKQYTIAFINEDGTVLQSSLVDYGEIPAYSGETPAKAATAKHSYTFDGWTPEIEAVTDDASYTATYTEIVNKYTIRFVDADGTELQSSEVAYGETPVYSGMIPTGTATPQYTDTFAGWNPAITTVTGEATYTAVYTRTANQYTITFDTSGGSEVAPITQAYGTAVTVPADPTRTGYSFVDWNPEIPATMPAEDMTILARWTANEYTISFDTDGGSNIDPITQNYGTAVTAPGHPVKEGHTFAGWDPEIPATMPAENITITAQWTADRYSISYQFNGGTNGNNPGSYTYGTGVSELADAVKPGYSFVGWYESADFSGNPVTSVAADRTGDITLYAKFEMGTIEAGTYSLTAGVAYRLGNVTKVSGDNSVYAPGNIFYVSVSGSYTFS